MIRTQHRAKVVPFGDHFLPLSPSITGNHNRPCERYVCDSVRGEAVQYARNRKQEERRRIVIATEGAPDTNGAKIR